jgi:hypothetical protein
LTVGERGAEEVWRKSTGESMPPPVVEQLIIKSIDEIGPDVDRKVNAAISANPFPAPLLTETLDRFDVAKDKLVPLVKKTQPRYWGLIKPTICEDKREKLHEAAKSVVFQMEVLKTYMRKYNVPNHSTLLTPDLDFVATYESF